MAAKHSGALELTWTDKDKALLSTGDGKYDYQFVDPADYRVNEVRLLHEVDSHSVEVPEGFELPFEPTNGNLLITGDAMHALDSLRMIPKYADKYVGKVKLVYIDPPFNTGQVFTDYEDNIKHSIWLTMLRDRLQQIVPLLSPDGSVWVHLDDVEVHRCRAVMDEVLGIENFIADISVELNPKGRQLDQFFAQSNDHILVYALNKSQAALDPSSTDEVNLADFKLRTDDGQPYRLLPLRNTNKKFNPQTRRNLYYPLYGDGESGRVDVEPFDGSEEIMPVFGDGNPAVWRWQKSTAAEKVDELRCAPVRGRGVDVFQIDIAHEDRTKKYKTVWLAKDISNNDTARSEVEAICGKSFDTPKPEALLKRIIEIGSDPGDIVLDCFAGSGTTAAVAHKLGRRWVTSELSTPNVNAYTKLRLVKVVNGEDPGGVSATTARVPSEGVELPDGVDAEQAQRFTTLVGKFGRELELPVDVAKQTAKVIRAQAKAGTSPLDDEERKTLIRLLNIVSKFADDEVIVNLMPDAVKGMRAAAKTCDETTVNWAGGGGFTHLQVGQSMFESSDGWVYLADWATNGALTDAMCAQLGIRHEPDGIFAGSKGTVRYVILDGMVTVSTIEAILDQLRTNEIVEVWATQVDTDAEERLRKARPGSKLATIPASVLDGYRRKAVKQSPFKPAQPNGEQS
ncbi:MAG: site-specific DNA-methyltransferase [Microthrixaceae bacterium]|nr:site-specific DNA-methyltransferase [Microthrixaceae bacterium]